MGTSGQAHFPRGNDEIIAKRTATHTHTHTNTLTLPLNDVLYLPKCNVPVSVQGGLIFGFVFEEKSVMYQFPANLS